MFRQRRPLYLSEVSYPSLHRGPFPAVGKKGRPPPVALAHKVPQGLSGIPRMIPQMATCTRYWTNFSNTSPINPVRRSKKSGEGSLLDGEPVTPHPNCRRRNHVPGGRQVTDGPLRPFQHGDRPTANGLYRPFHLSPLCERPARKRAFCQSKPPVKRTVCIGPVGASHRLSPARGHRRFLFALRAPPANRQLRMPFCAIHPQNRFSFCTSDPFFQGALCGKRSVSPAKSGVGGLELPQKKRGVPPSFLSN